MKILIFTEGTIIMHQTALGVSREERVKKSNNEGIQREEASLNYNSKTDVPVERGSVYDFVNYLPNGKAVEKIQTWKDLGAMIYYLTSRRIKADLDAIVSVLEKYNFADNQNLFFRKQGENYADVVARIIPDILIEDDCESIGGENEMTYPHLSPILKKKIHSIVVKEFAGIDNLPDDLSNLKNYHTI
jgi:hypothetical protein